MAKSVVALLSALLAISLSGCEPTIRRIKPDSPLKKSVVVVRDFKADDAEVTNWDSPVAAYGAEFATQIVKALREAGVSAEKASDSAGTAAGRIVVEGQVTFVDGGNRGLRCFVGYGAGSASVGVSGLARIEDGRRVEEFAVERGSSWYDVGDDTLRRCIKAISYDIATMVTTGKFQMGEHKQRSIAARLRELDRLREQRLVTPEEYERKRSSILNGL